MSRGQCFFLLVLVICALAGCTNSHPYVEVGAGYNDSFTNEKYKWNNAGSLGATIEVGYEGKVKNNPNLTAGCRYLHVSQWFAGRPINTKSESSLDHFGCKTRYTFK